MADKTAAAVDSKPQHDIERRLADLEAQNQKLATQLAASRADGQRQPRRTRRDLADRDEERCDREVWDPRKRQNVRCLLRRHCGGGHIYEIPSDERTLLGLTPDRAPERA